MKTSGKNVIKLNDIIPEEGSKWEDVVRISKEIHEEYRIALRDITYNKMNVFEGYEYQIYIQLTFLIRLRKILEERIPTIFVLDTRFTSAYFAVLKFAETLGYSIEMRIGLVNNDQIEYHREGFDENVSYYRKKRFTSKQKQILKHSFGSGLSFNKIKTYYKFLSEISRFLLHSASYKLQSIVRVDITRKILDKIDKKILKDGPYESTCCFFVSAIREDIYIRPLYPIMDKLKNENHHFHIMTSDISTGLVLSNRNRPFINIFDEFDIIYQKTRKELKVISSQIAKIAQSETSLFAFREFTTELIDKSCRTISVMIICEHILSKMNLKSIMVAPTGEIFENTVIEIAKKYSVPSFSIYSGPIGVNPFYSRWFKADKIFVDGLKTKEVLTKLEYDEERIVVTGNPMYDYIKNFDPSESKIKLEQDLKIDSKKKLIVIGRSRWRDGDEVWISDLIRFCNKNNYEIVIKLHPLYKIQYEHSKNKIEKISKNCEGLRFFIIQQIDLPILLSAADILITDYSNIGIEAIFHDKPLLSVNLTKEEWDEHPARVENYDASFYIEDYAELEEKLNEILKEGKHLLLLKEGRKKVVINYNFGNDGKAANRIYEVIKNS